METFELQSAKQIARELAKRAKAIRKRSKKTQKGFAEFSGIPFGTYARFEKTGQLQLEDFILVMQRLGRVEELSGMLTLKEEIRW